MPNSPVTGRAVYLSVSGFKTWSLCRRRWWYDKVQGRKEPPSAVFAMGIAVHSALEEYLRTGKWSTPGLPQRAVPAEWTPGQLQEARETALVVAKTGQASLDDLRALANPSVVEHTIRIPAGHPASPFALDYFGQVDYAVTGDLPLVVDHKTTGDLSGSYHLDQDGLARDPQLLLYAGLLWGATRPERVEVRHLYYQTPAKGKAPAHKVLSATVPWSACQAMVDTFARESEAMAAALTKPAEEMATSPTACRAFGRLCPHADVCSMSPENREQAVTQAAIKALLQGRKTTPKPTKPRGGPMSLRDRLRAKALGETPPPQAAPPPDPRVAQAAITPPDAPPTPTPTDAQRAEAAKAIKAVLDAGVPYADDWAVRTVTNLGLPAEDLGKVKALAGLEAAPPPPAEPDPTQTVPDHPEEDPDQDSHHRALMALADAVKAAGDKGIPTANAKKVAGKVLAKTRWPSDEWSALLAEGAECGLWDYSSSRVLPPPSAPQETSDAPAPIEAPPAAPEPPSAPQAPAAVPPRADQTQLPQAPKLRAVLVGCMARSLMAAHLLTALEEANIPQDVAEANGVSHWRLVKFGDGVKHLASRLTVALRDGLELPPVLYCEPGSDLAQYVVPVLDAAGWLVIRGEV